MKIPAVLVRLLLPMAGLVSAYFLLRGHNAPGGGFVGGLVRATAVIAQYMVGGTIWVESRLRVHPLVWIGLGLLAAAVRRHRVRGGALPFLTALATDFHLPVLGDVHLSTALLFDLGVYTLVVGATLLMLVALAHQSLRRPRKTAVASAGGTMRNRRRAPERRSDGDRLRAGIGILAGSGVWLLLRPRTFQVLMGLTPALVRDQPLHLRHGPARAAPARRSSSADSVDAIPRCTRTRCRRRSC